MTVAVDHESVASLRRRRGVRAAGFALALGFAVAASDVHGARPCGDADGNDVVTVTDGVIVLRSAAGLPSIATRDCCDMDFNGSISVSDGVLALRAAADLPGATCVADQLRDGLARFGPIHKVGGTLSAGSHALAHVAETEPCPGGGFSIVETNRIEDVGCQTGDIVTTGVITLDDAPPAATFTSFQAVNLATSETLLSSGTIAFRENANGILAIGVIARTSSAPAPSRNGRGEFLDELRDVLIDSDGRVLSGSLLTTVTAGRGVFASVRSIESFFVSPDLTIAVVDFATADQQVGIVAEDALGLCRTCESSSACGDPLICLPCAADCADAAPSRCTVNFQNFAARCEDGLY